MSDAERTSHTARCRGRLDGVDPRVRRATGVGGRPRRPGRLRQPGGPRGARLRRAVRAQGALRPRRHPLQAPRRLALPGRGLPDDEGPRDRRDDPHGGGLVRPPRRHDVPGLLHGDAARAARRPGRGRRLQGHRGAARGRAGAARARGDPREGRPAGVGHRRRRLLPLRQPGRAGRARLRRGLGPRGQARSRQPSTTSTPTARRSPRTTARSSRPAGRGGSCRTPTTGSCTRTARSCA